MLAAMVRDLHLVGLRSHDNYVPQSLRDLGKTPSDFVIMARAASDFDHLNQDPTWFKLNDPGQIQPWTDDFSNILGAFEW